MSTVQLSRDPFSRTALMRESRANPQRAYECLWCGQAPRTLYRYWQESDSSRRNAETTKWFCNRSCANSYHS